ncbi:MAG: methylmalonyl Co-A mutase-associated GTPase MeaB [Acidimicrobiales bacterium]
MTGTPPVHDLVEGLRSRNRRSVAQAITLVESNSERDLEAKVELLDLLAQEPHPSTVRIGISGTPGVGKSTLIEAVGVKLINKGHRLAVLAVDPTSARTRGSILGDKTRMPQLSVSGQAFVRPSPAGFGLGGITTSTASSIAVCEAGGFDVIFVETVGVGQSETAVAGVTDLFLLLHSPGGGDELQGIKRGVMELADWVAVTKADGDLLPAARRAESELKMALHLMRPKPGRDVTPVTLCSALDENGLDEIIDGLFELHRTLQSSGDIGRLRNTQAYNQFRAAYEQGIFSTTDHGALLFDPSTSPVGAAHRALRELDHSSEVNAVTLFIADMGRSINFYRTLGLELTYGGAAEAFSTLRIGANFVNLELKPSAMPVKHWGRTILFVPDPDAVHTIATDAGFQPHGEPADAPWGERFFHISDPDGHELSFARPI